MMYNGGFPVGYQPYPQYYMPNNYVQPQMSAQQQDTGQIPIRDGGIVRVQSEQEARNYLVARGSSVTFKDENAPYMYVKTVGFGQLDQPVFERWKLERDDSAVMPNEPKESPAYALKEDQDKVKFQIETMNTEVDGLNAEIEGLKVELEVLKKQLLEQKRTMTKKKEEGDL